ncbi:MAG: putative 2OG-Fe(II) oxygenase [Pseudomonadota bacterium]
MSRLIGLFPTPLLRVDGFADAALQRVLVERALAGRAQGNSGSDELSHTELVDPRTDAVFESLLPALQPHLVRFGALLFAKEQPWYVKELWLNVLETGGSQFLHTHANSFASGILYLQQPADASHTMFRRNSGGGEFIFRNDIPAGHFSSDTFFLDDVSAGDLVLYPSYLMHGVPPNEGAQRITLAFNAIPDELDSLGYRIRFGPGRP